MIDFLMTGVSDSSSMHYVMMVALKGN